MSVITYGLYPYSPEFELAIKDAINIKTPRIVIIAPSKSGKNSLANHLKMYYFPKIKIYEKDEFMKFYKALRCDGGIYVSQEFLPNYVAMDDIDYIFYSNHNKSHKFYKDVVKSSGISSDEFWNNIIKMRRENPFSFAGINMRPNKSCVKSEFPDYGLYRDSYELNNIINQLPNNPKILIQGPACWGKTILAHSLKMHMPKITIYDENFISIPRRKDLSFPRSDGGYIIVGQSHTTDDMKQFDYIFYVGNDVRRIKQVYDEIVKFNYTVDRKSFVREILDLSKYKKYSFTGIRVNPDCDIQFPEKFELNQPDLKDSDFELDQPSFKVELDQPNLKESDFENVNEEEIPSADLIKTNTDKINKSKEDFCNEYKKYKAECINAINFASNEGIYHIYFHCHNNDKITKDLKNKLLDAKYIVEFVNGKPKLLIKWRASI